MVAEQCHSGRGRRAWRRRLDMLRGKPQLTKVVPQFMPVIFQPVPCQVGDCVCAPRF